MSDAGAGSALELEVTDFGPIAEGRIELRPLTVFVGPSNTGKSYLAILIYALHRYFSGRAWVPHYFPAYVSRRAGRTPPLRRETVDALREMLQRFTAGGEAPVEETMVLPRPVSEAIISELARESRAVARQIQRCFGLDGRRSLIRKGRSDHAQVTLRRQSPDRPVQFEYTLILGEKASKASLTRPGKLEVPIDSEVGHRAIQRLQEIAEGAISEGETAKGEHYFSLRLIEELESLVLPRLIGPLNRPAFYLPADRTGVMHAHSVVVSALVENAATAGLRPPAHTPMLSGVMADFLEQLIEIGRSPRPMPHSRDNPGERIENAILGGAVRVNRLPATGYPSFAYRPDGWKNDLSLMNASSMVSELAPIVLYLRHVVRCGHLLIVEEPESHLHPAMQVEFTRQLAALVLSGVRVIVTTHSEWLLDELANVVQRAEGPNAPQGEFSRDRPALPPDKVGAWLFRPTKRPKGSRVSEIRLDESGLYPSGFDDVAAALHNDWADIAGGAADGA